MVTIAKTLKIHDLTSNQTVDTLKRNDELKSSFYAVKPIGTNLVAAGDDDGHVFVWDLRTPPGQVVLDAQNCDQYISDIDTKFETKKLMICTSGEGTLTAYDIRAMKMIEPQSELFEAGFQCVKLVDLNKKVVVGAEDGALYVFNQGEWANTSGKFAISSDKRNRGRCSIDCLDLLPTGQFLAGCSDGRVRSLTLWPQQILSETSFCKRSPIESIHVSPVGGKSEFVVSGGEYLNIVEFEEKTLQNEDVDDDESDEDSDESDDESEDTDYAKPSAVHADPDLAESDKSEESNVANKNKAPDNEQNQNKKFKEDNDEDYLNLF